MLAHLMLEMALRQRAQTMVAISHMRQRLDALLEDGQTFSRGLSRTGWGAALLCDIPPVWGAGAVELDRQAEQAPASAAPTRNSTWCRSGLAAVCRSLS
ncbi:hypothetical protein SBA3_960014 [Candidatus Sulfopaludibacter sp. SbA3]|nr:hypothetical protein SBA3_960014 [Candidatus Sulfopaludibacter sp. SbA3]